ncbi:MAG: hypothetical protein AMXMBFR77_05700 [Phycisphaerales bacterium]|nr:transcriptional repressor [Phycisphaerales bacterium]GIK19852.1 MAG: hypothetical protein BroJett004_20160 [Planctomycetota bacterium]
MHDQAECVREVFRRHGLRCTRQREVLYDALAASRSHPTAEELFDSVRNEDESLSLATVYNTLEAFTQAGLCRRIPSTNGNGPCRFDAEVHQHVHLALPDGRVLDVPEELGEKLMRCSTIGEIARRMGLDLSKVSVQLVVRERPEA